MKTYKHLMEQFLSDENYYLAVRNATKHKGGKRKKYRTARFYRDNAEALKDDIIDYALHFQNAEHRPRLIYDGIRRKQRTIIVPTMREQIIHHMIVNILKPIFMKGMYEHSYGSIPGRGSHLAKKRIEKWISTGGRNCKYCLKMDIRKYFDSIPHNILKAKLSEIIKDEEFLKVVFTVIDVTDVGIPIGFYTSQWFANWYLTDLDHYIKEELHAKFYPRYMDDMAIFGGNKRELHEIRRRVEAYLNNELGLQMKSDWRVFLFDYTKKDGTIVGSDLDFMGFRFFRDRTILRKTLMLKATRKAKKISRKKIKTIYDCRQMLSYLGWIDCTDTYEAYKKRIKPFVNFQYLKRRESIYQRRVNNVEKSEQR